MASEYLCWKYRDVQPDAAPRALSGREKLKNWLHYHKWWLLVGAVLVWILGGVLWDALGIGKTQPDYILAYVGREALPETLCGELSAALEQLGADGNGDGRVRVELRQYVTERSGDPVSALGFQYAEDTRLLADITAGESYFFLTDDPERLQRNYQILADWDGSAPEEDDERAEGKVLRWEDCPVLAGLELEQARLSGLWLGRRCFYDGAHAEERARSEAFWLLLTKGASR